MRTAALSNLYAASGPFASVTLDVSHDTENGEHEHELRVRAACEALSEAGAPDDVVTHVSDRLGELVNEAAPGGRTVVATIDGGLVHEMTHNRVDPPCAPGGPPPGLTTGKQ